MMLLTSVGLARVRNTFDGIVRLIDDGVVLAAMIKPRIFSPRHALSFSLARPVDLSSAQRLNLPPGAARQF
jgi:hypothetical protein